MAGHFDVSSGARKKGKTIELQQNKVSSEEMVATEDPSGEVISRLFLVGVLLCYSRTEQNCFGGCSARMASITVLGGVLLRADLPETNKTAKKMEEPSARVPKLFEVDSFSWKNFDSRLSMP